MSTLRKALLIELIRKSILGWIVVYAYCNRTDPFADTISVSASAVKDVCRADKVLKSKRLKPSASNYTKSEITPFPEAIGLQGKLSAPRSRQSHIHR